MAEEGRQRAHQQRGADDTPGQAAQESMQPDATPKARVPSPVLRRACMQTHISQGVAEGPSLADGVKSQRHAALYTRRDGGASTFEEKPARTSTHRQNECKQAARQMKRSW